MLHRRGGDPVCVCLALGVRVDGGAVDAARGGDAADLVLGVPELMRQHLLVGGLAQVGDGGAEADRLALDRRQGAHGVGHGGVRLDLKAGQVLVGDLGGRVAHLLYGVFMQLDRVVGAGFEAGAATIGRCSTLWRFLLWGFHDVRVVVELDLGGEEVHFVSAPAVVDQA